LLSYPEDVIENAPARPFVEVARAVECASPVRALSQT